MAKYRIIIIDDDDDARKMLSMALETRFEVIEACDGLEALSKLETHEPDFAIIDIMMPMMDGYQVCEAIRRHRKFNTMQVLFLSAFGSKENIKKSYAAGANLFLTKPVDPTRVLRNIEFTVQHEPPPLRNKRYTLEQLKAIEEEETRKRARATEHPQPSEPTPPPPKEKIEEEAPEKVPEAIPDPAPIDEEANENVHPALVDVGVGLPRILAVDDDPEALQILDMALREEFEITTASDGIEAIERIVVYEPDLLLIDIMMPKMNGYQLLQSIRRNLYLRGLPVIVLSAKSTPKDRDYAMRLGATDFLAKPYGVDELTQTLERIVSAPDFQVRPKKSTLFEIRDTAYREKKERDKLRTSTRRKREYAEMQDVIEHEKGDSSEKRNPKA